jgi:hypothetical protein
VALAQDDSAVSKRPELIGYVDCLKKSVVALDVEVSDAATVAKIVAPYYRADFLKVNNYTAIQIENATVEQKQFWLADEQNFAIAFVLGCRKSMLIHSAK